MQELSTIIKTVKVVMRDWREFPVSERQYMTLKSMKSNDRPTKMVSIKEENNWSILFEWELRDIKEFSHKSKVRKEYKYICEDCWKAVPIFEKCPDYEKHWERKMNEWEESKRLKWEEIIDYTPKNYHNLTINQLV